MVYHRQSLKFDGEQLEGGRILSKYFVQSFVEKLSPDVDASLSSLQVTPCTPSGQIPGGCSGAIPATISEFNSGLGVILRVELRPPHSFLRVELRPPHSILRVELRPPHSFLELSFGHRIHF